MKKSLYLLIAFFLFTVKLNAIENITINNETLIPNFSKDTKVYNVYVSEQTEIISINITSSENELITGSGSKSLKKGINTFEINSYINNELESTYVLNIIRGEDQFNEDESNLESLYIKGYNIDFKSDIYNYEINVKENTLPLYITYNANNPESTVKLIETKDMISIKVTSKSKKNESIYKIKLLEDNIVSKENKLINHKEKTYDEFELKIIRIIISCVSLIITGVIFYLFFIRKKKNT